MTGTTPEPNNPESTGHPASDGTRSDRRLAAVRGQSTAGVLTWVAAEQRVIVGTVNTEEYFINGKGCEPRTANASLTVDRDGGVSITHP